MKTAKTTLISGIRRSGQAALGDFWTFLKCPTLEEREAARPILKPLLMVWLLIFAFATTAMFALLALPLLLVSQVAAGDNLEQVLEASPFSILVALVLLGPLVEEMIFRGWLTGTVRAFLGTAVFLGVFYGGAFVLGRLGDEPIPGAMQIGVSALAFLLFLLILRYGPAFRPASYRHLFPYAFWLQGLVFGGLHFANLSGSSIVLPLLMTIPLVMCGWIFAYARVVAGFGGAWLLHALYNIPSAIGAILIPVLAPP